MPETKKLDNEELKKVNGGAAITFDRFDVGDVFKLNDFSYFVVSRTANGPFNDRSRIYIRLFKMSDGKLVPNDDLENDVSYAYLTSYPYLPLLSDPNLINNNNQ